MIASSSAARKHALFESECESRIHFILLLPILRSRLRNCQACYGSFFYPAAGPRIAGKWIDAHSILSANPTPCRCPGAFRRCGVFQGCA